MKFPKLKNALFCRILVYVVVLGGFIAPVIIVANLSFVHDIIKLIVVLAFVIALLIYLIKNFMLLMAMDIGFAKLHCNNTARKKFTLPRSFTIKKVENRILKYAKQHSPIAISPKPHILRYKSNAPLTVYSSGIEKVVAVYSTMLLDSSQYHSIIRSANANSTSLKGKKKHRFLAKSQKKAPLNRVTVIIIFAKEVESRLRENLFKTVCQNGGDGYDTATIPCVVDLETRTATFDSIRMPYVGFQYPVKNRGIRLIRRFLFKGKLTYANSPDKVEPINDMNPEQSLWSFWRNLKKELITDDKEAKKRYDKMEHRQLIFEDGSVYLKWEDKGIWVSVELDEETKIAQIDSIDCWYYPKANKIAKATITEMKGIISLYFAELGYTTSFLSYD